MTIVKKCSKKRGPILWSALCTHSTKSQRVPSEEGQMLWLERLALIPAKRIH